MKVEMIFLLKVYFLALYDAKLFWGNNISQIIPLFTQVVYHDRVDWVKRGKL
jgi:hypothetical protein